MALRLLRMSAAYTIGGPSTKAKPCTNHSSSMSNKPLKHNNTTRLLAAPYALPKPCQELARETLAPSMLSYYRNPLLPSKKDMTAKPSCILKKGDRRHVSSSKRVVPLPLPTIPLKEN